MQKKPLTLETFGDGDPHLPLLVVISNYTNTILNVIGSYRFYSSQIDQNGIGKISIKPFVIIFEPLSFLCKHNEP